MTTRGTYELSSGAISERKDDRWKICVIIPSFIIICATIIMILWIQRSRITKDDYAGHRSEIEDPQVPLFEQLKQNVSMVTLDVAKSEPTTMNVLRAVPEKEKVMVETTTLPIKNWTAVEKMTNVRTITEETTTMLKPTAHSTETTTDETREPQRTMEQTTETWRIIWNGIKNRATEMYKTSKGTTEMDTTIRQTTETQETTETRGMMRKTTDTQERTDETTVMQTTSEEMTQMQETEEEITETQTPESQVTKGSSFRSTEHIAEGTDGTTTMETTMDEVKDMAFGMEASKSLETTEHTTEASRTVSNGTKKQATETYKTSEATTEMDTTIRQTTDKTTETRETMRKTTDMQGMTDETTVMQTTNEEMTETQETEEEITEMQTPESQVTTSSSFRPTEHIAAGTDGAVTTEIFEPTEATIEMSETTIEVEIVNSTTLTQDAYQPDPCNGETNNVKSRMNCNISPCVDFHAYACRASDFDSEEQTLERDINRRIRDQAKANPHSTASKQFMKYYNSCLSYSDLNETARLKLEVSNFCSSPKIGQLDLFHENVPEVGQFHHVYKSSEVQFDLTDILYQLLSHDSAPLFDVDLEVDLVNPKELVFTLRPRLHKSALYVDNGSQDGYTALSDANENNYEALHQEYMIDRHIDDMRKIANTVQMMKLISAPMFTTDEALEIEIDVDRHLYPHFILNDKVDISENYKRKRLSDWTEDLIKANGECLNLSRLLSNLSGKKVDDSSVLQIYLPEHFLNGVGKICNAAKENPGKINNAFLGLYIQHVYDSLVKRPLNLDDYCMRAAKSLLEPQASEFYMSSFTDEELQKKNESVYTMFEELKETFRLEMNGIEWADEPGREKVMEKLDSMSLIVPQAALYEKKGSQHSMTRWDEMNFDSNFFDNTIRLLKMKRKLMYERWQKDPNDMEQIWTHYAVPYHTSAISIYRLNSIVLPLGAVDWALLSYDNATHDLKLATLGNLISREMARQFDVWGLKYYRDNEAESVFFHNDEQAQISYEAYARCHRTLHGDRSELGERTLNERLSDTVGLQLAYDTMMRMTSNSSSNVSAEKRFFVAYAQMLCKQNRLSSSFWISLDAEEHLPARPRTSAVLSSNKHVGQLWRCHRGSATYPHRFCSVFPKINSPEQEILDPSRR